MVNYDQFFRFTVESLTTKLGIHCFLNFIFDLHHCKQLVIGQHESILAIFIDTIGWMNNPTRTQWCASHIIILKGINKFLGMNFENLIVKFHIPYILNMYIKFRSNWILFTIWPINLFFIYNFRLQKLEIITFIWLYSNWFFIFLKLYKH